jgi:hypothetical protein
VKSPMLLLQELLTEVGSWCRTCTIRDFKTIADRVECEGPSFLTITLPAFCVDFERSLDEGKVDRSLFTSFKWKGGLPLFLGGFLDLIFDRGTGVLLNDPSHDAIFAIRQVTRLFSKVIVDDDSKGSKSAFFVPCSDARTRAALAGFVECENEVRVAEAGLPASLRDDFSRVGNLLWRDVLTIMDKFIYDGDIMPKHGPGATADKLRGNAKYQQLEWPERLEEVFPMREFLVPNDMRYIDRLDRTRLIEPGAERPVRVITVPKTMKTPRIIAVEPTAMQYAQQGVLEALVQSVHDDKIMGQMVGFRDQVPNQHLAREGSLTGDLATLDLSEASDRVSNQHVQLLASRFPWFSRALDATRSRKADVLGYGVLDLAKFASMGSALCFPMEAMVFATVVFVGIEKELNTRLTRKHVESLTGQVRIYGDDIIVPVEYVHSVVKALEAFGLKVNAKKSFWTGKFRESCGKEYYDGTDVSIVKVRRELPRSQRHVQEIISAVSTMNQLYEAGLSDTADWLKEQLGRLIPLPEVLPTSPVLGVHVNHLPFGRTCANRHVPLVKGYVVKARLPNSPLDGSDALLKWFLKRGDKPFADKGHLERAGRPLAVDIKLGWYPAL